MSPAVHLSMPQQLFGLDLADGIQVVARSVKPADAPKSSVIALLDRTRAMNLAIPLTKLDMKPAEIKVPSRFPPLTHTTFYLVMSCGRWDWKVQLQQHCILCVL